MHPLNPAQATHGLVVNAPRAVPAWANPGCEPVFVWTRAFETGIAAIDDQHRNLVGILNAIGGLVVRRDAPTGEMLTHHLEALARYAIEHFRDEEKEMDEAQVWSVHRTRHRREHRYFVSELDRIVGSGAMDDRDTAREVLRFLSSWLAYHILGIDLGMARQIARIRAGETPEDAFLHEEGPVSAPHTPLLSAVRDLVRHVATRNEALHRLNATLELRVEERTAELTEAVQRLEQERQASHELSNRLAIANRRLEAMAMTDALSGLPNRRHAMARLQRAWEEAGEPPVSVIMVDADHFKEVNDTFGHDAGDAVIVRLARELRHAIRTDDIACRMGGDEFLVICPHTHREGARMVAETIRSRVDGLSVPCEGGHWSGSVSVGVATRTARMSSLHELVKAADDAVYRAKRSGRNVVVEASF